LIVNTLSEAPRPFRQTEVYTLSNGLKILLLPDNTIPVVAAQAWVRCGAVDESPAQYGISHGLEHMVFKGTPTRTAAAISGVIESQGGVINAATQLETTHYYIEVPSYGLEAALDVLVDTLLHPTFPQEELERERLVILEEIFRRDDSPESTLWDEFASAVFKGTPYEITVIGTKDTVSTLKREDLNQYFSKYYVPQNLNFVVVGDFDRDRVLQKLKSSFEPLATTKAPDAPLVQLDKWAATHLNVKKPIQLSYLAAGFPTVGLGEKDAVALDLLSDVLGGGNSSRLVQNLRQDRQMVLSVSCEYIPFKQKGMFAFFLDTLPQKSQSALDSLYQEIQRIKEEGIKEDELSRAKARTKSDWFLGSETPRGCASTLGSLSVLGQLDLVTNYMARINALTVNDLMQTYQRYIEKADLTVVRLEPAV